MGEGINVVISLLVWERVSISSYSLSCGRGREDHCRHFVVSVRKGEGINSVVLFIVWEREIHLVVENKLMSVYSQVGNVYPFNLCDYFSFTLDAHNSLSPK